MRVRNSKNVVSLYRPDLFADYLNKLGVSKNTAIRVAMSVPVIEAQKNRSEITTRELRNLAHEVAETGDVENFTANNAGSNQSESVFDAELSDDEVSGERLFPQPQSVFEIPLIGLVAEAKIVAEVNPELAEFMEALLLYVRAAAEESFRENSKLIREPLTDMGLTTKAIDGIENRLLDHHFPLPSAALIENLTELQEKLVKTGDMIFENPAGSLTCALLCDAYSAFNDAPRTTTNRYWSTDAPLKEVPEHFYPEDWIYIRRPPIEFSAVALASIERPIQASGSTFAAQAITPASSTNDDLRATDTTYLNTVIDVYAGDNLRHYSSPSPVIPPKYHQPPRDEIKPSGWVENLKPGFNVLVYTFSVTEKNQFPYADQLNELIKDNDEKIKDKIDELAEQAGEAAEDAASATPIAPVADLAGKLVDQVVKQGLKIIYELVKDAFGDGFFPPVRIVHTVNYNPPAMPHSIFVVMVGDTAQNKLFAITRDTDRPNIKATLNQDPRGNPFYPIGNGKSRRFQTLGRTMLGYTQSPPGVVPLDLWKQVGDKKAVAEWASAADRQGFRIVASIPQNDGDGNYVWALRADVYAVDEDGNIVSLA